MENLWEEMKAVVIKTLLISHKGIKCYKRSILCSIDSIVGNKIDVKFHNIILSFSETCSDFIEASPKSMYNCYKLLGFDVLVDNNLKVSNGISKVNELIIIYYSCILIARGSNLSKTSFFQRCI